MATWQQLADELKTDPVLTKLDEEHVEAIIDVLLLTMHADEKVAFMEEAEFEHLLHELPWMQDKQEKIHAHIEATTGKIKTIENESDFRALADNAAKVLVEESVREKAYHMAVALAGADMELHPEEHRVLTWLAECFEIPETKRAILS